MTERVGRPARRTQLFYLLLMWDITAFGESVLTGGAINCTNSCFLSWQITFLATQHLLTNLGHMNVLYILCCFGSWHYFTEFRCPFTFCASILHNIKLKHCSDFALLQLDQRAGTDEMQSDIRRERLSVILFGRHKWGNLDGCVA